MNGLRRAIRVCAVAYPVFLLGLVLALRFGGPRYWQAELALYLPRVIFAAPLLLLVPLLLFVGPRWLLWSQALAAWIVVFPLMGFVWNFPTRSMHEAKRLRVLSYNSDFVHAGPERITAQVLAFKPDIAVFQQTFYTERLSRMLRSKYPVLQTDGEFFIASRFALRSTYAPDQNSSDRHTNLSFVRYSIDTNLGRVSLYSMHPFSPLYQIRAARSGGFRRAIVSGRILSLARRPEIDVDSELRARQTRTVAAAASADRNLVIIAGDTNLPQLSRSLEHFDEFQDGFRAVGFGFGYTFPDAKPWMRIDRIFAGRGLRFANFSIGHSHASDHRCVVADIARAE